MKRVLRLFILEQKIARRCAIKVCATVLIMMGLLSMLLMGYLQAVKSDNSKAIIKIGVVNEEGHEGIGSYVTFANKLSSLKDFCRLESMNKEEAFQGLSEGKLQMVMVIPENFLNDAIHMRDASFTVYLPSKEMSLGDRKIIDLMLAVEDIMLATEGTITSMYRGMEYYSFETTVTEMENTLTNLFVSELLNRDSYFNVKYTSGFGEFSIVEYYIGAAVIMCIMIAGMFYLSMYNEQIFFIERLCTKSVSDRFVFILLKVLNISLCLCVPMWIMMLLADTIFDVMGSQLIYVRFEAYLMVFLICVSVAAFVNMMGMFLSNSVDKTVTYILVVVFLGIISGVVGTKYYLPKLLRDIADYWPVSCYHRKFMISMWDFTDAKDYLQVCIYSVVMLIVGALLFIKTDWKKNTHEKSVY